MLNLLNKSVIGGYKMLLADLKLAKQSSAVEAY